MTCKDSGTTRKLKYHYLINSQRVLLHELTHMIHSSHDEKFHALNRELDKEAIALDWTQTKGHKISNDMFYEPLDEARYKSLLERPEIVDSHGFEGVGYILEGKEVKPETEQGRRIAAEKAALGRRNATEQ
jgi:hypothetical protein